MSEKFPSLILFDEAFNLPRKLASVLDYAAETQLLGAVSSDEEEAQLLGATLSDAAKATFLCSAQVFQACHPDDDYKTFVALEMEKEVTISKAFLFLDSLSNIKAIDVPWFLSVFKLIKGGLGGSTLVMVSTTLFKTVLRQLIQNNPVTTSDCEKLSSASPTLIPLYLVEITGRHWPLRYLGRGTESEFFRGFHAPCGHLLLHAATLDDANTLAAQMSTCSGGRST